MFHQSFEDSIRSKKIIIVNDYETKDENLTDSTVEARCKLASLCRLIDLYKFSQSIYNHVTVRLPDTNLLLINPFGLLLSEITASNLVVVDLDGNIIKAGLPDFGVNKAGCVLHSAIHKVRHDVNCVIHVHTSPIVAVSCMQDGLLPISQEAMIIGDVSYYTYNGIAINDDAKQIASSLGPKNKVMILRNHGAMCVGSTVEEAFYWLFNLYLACQHQVLTLSSGFDQLIFPSSEAKEQVKSTISHAYEKVKVGGNVSIHWEFGELEYEAHMRVLDRYGYNTGYPFKSRGIILNPKIKRASNVAKKINYNKSNSSGIYVGNVCSDESLSVAYSVDSGAHVLIDSEVTGYDSDNMVCAESEDENMISHSMGSLNKADENNIPKSESSREMFIRFTSQSTSKVDEPVVDEKVATSHSGSPTRSQNRHESLQRRSKSLTSGVERAIYRRISEKYRCEIK